MHYCERTACSCLGAFWDTNKHQLQYVLQKIWQGGSKNPFGALGNMGNIMENVKKAQQLVQVEAAKAQEELARCALVAAVLNREQGKFASMHVSMCSNIHVSMLLACMSACCLA